MGAMDVLTGPMLIGTVLNGLLYGMILSQCLNYFVAYGKRDRLPIKLLVSFLLLADTVNFAFDVAFTYRYTITLFGNFEAVALSNWVFNTDPVMVVIISSTVQSFFAWRVARLTGYKWIGILLGLSAFAQFLCGLGTAIGCSIVKEFLRFQEFRVVVIIWLVLSAVTDIAITGILSWYLHSHRTGFSSTNDIISRLIRITVQTGLITTIWAIVDLIVYLSFSNSLHLIFNIPLCKLYTISLLSTLNTRGGWNTSYETKHEFSHSDQPRSGGQAGTGRVGQSNTWNDPGVKSTSSGIQVVTSSTVHHDVDLEMSAYPPEHKMRSITEFTRQGDDHPTPVRLMTSDAQGEIEDEASMHSDFDRK